MSEDKIVLTSTRRGKTSVLKIERTKAVNSQSVVHEGKGENRGLVVNQQAAEPDSSAAPHLQLEFKCWLINQSTGERVPEQRVLKFWFVADADYLDRVSLSYEFFRELVQPNNFPRDYLNFIKKCMKQMQAEYFRLMKEVDVELTLLDSGQDLLLPPGVHEQDTRTAEEKLRDQLLYLLESAYPNILEIDELARITGATEAEIMELLQELANRGLVKKMDNTGAGSGGGPAGGWVRRDEATEQTVVLQLPTIAGKQQPTIAVITSNYYEKLAVDAMMENKTTYVKFQTAGDAHVYTLGYIGEHKIVSTKLSQIGRTQGAKISSGNITTRLLGTFGNIEHVFVVGTAGGVPHYTDYYKHVRLGDVVVSTGNEKGHIYIFCDKTVEDRKTHEISYQVKTYAPRDKLIQDKINEIRSYCSANPAARPWDDYIKDGQLLLHAQEVSFDRPPPESDKLYMSLGEQDVIEVSHPQPPQGSAPVPLGQLTVRYGPVGSGRSVIRGSEERQAFAYKHGIMAFDNEFDQVLDSVIGNVKYSYVLIRGIVDYSDGSSSSGKKWLPYSALAAASLMKLIIKSLPAVM